MCCMNEFQIRAFHDFAEIYSKYEQGFETDIVDIGSLDQNLKILVSFPHLWQL